MADVSKIKLPDSSEYNIKDYRIPGVDTTPTSGSDNVVTSGGVYDKINDESLVISTALNDLNDRITTIEDDGITTEPFSEIDPVSIEYYTKVEIDDLLSEIDVEETDPIFSASPAANITSSDITNWNNKTNNKGTVTQVNVGSTSYNPSNGVISLPAYPTTLPASDVSAWAKASTKPTYTANEVGALPNTTVIPAAPGTLTTTSTTALNTATNESLSGNISLHKVAKTGTYNDLIGKPTIPAAQVQSDWNATSGMGVILNKPTIPTVEALTTSEIDTIWNNAT